jgi:hypothetical protein
VSTVSLQRTKFGGKNRNRDWSISIQSNFFSCLARSQETTRICLQNMSIMNRMEKCNTQKEPAYMEKMNCNSSSPKLIVRRSNFHRSKFYGLFSDCRSLVENFPSLEKLFIHSIVLRSLVFQIQRISFSRGKI